VTGAAHWQTLQDELTRWREAGLVAPFWLRDDDAIAPTKPLDHLLDITGRRAIPVTIAVIPALTGQALAQYLAAARHATPVVHGWKHENHAPPAEKKQELGPHRPLDQILTDLSAALQRMHQLHGGSVVPMLVPPWNRIDPALLPFLRGLEFSALSCFGPAPLAVSVPVINTHVDLIDWRGTRGSRDHASLVRDIVKYLQRAERNGEPVGILGHHLVHDQAAWSFLEHLFERTAGHPGCKWLSAAEVIGANRRHG
jgi:hypothetical protein